MHVAQLPFPQKKMTERADMTTKMVICMREADDVGSSVI
jgi:hypothetical protein